MAETDETLEKQEKQDAKGSHIPSGRLSRFARMASLTARTAGDLALGRAKRAMGDDSYTQEREAAKKVLETLGTMKGAAMKLGQQLAMEADALPPEAQAIVAKLFAQAPAMSYDDMAKVIEEELDDAPEKVFAEFDHTPLASASLGQVHKARLKDGTPVAVKVQYPGVAEALVSDLKNAGLMVKAFGGTTKALSKLDTGPYYEEIRREISFETDYVREARNADAYRKAVADLPDLHVPQTHAAYSSGRVLTMDFVEGIPLHKYVATNPSPEERFRVSTQLAAAVLTPFLRYRMIHADPHPGNFLVRPDGKLTILDFGAVKTLSPQFGGAFRNLFSAPVEGRAPDLMKVMADAGFIFNGDLKEIERVCMDLHRIAERPLVQEEYDWGTDKIVPDIRSMYVGKKMSNDLQDLLSVQSPAECIFFYRAIGGLANNLRTLKGAGPYRAHARWMLSLPVGSGT